MNHSSTTEISSVIKIRKRHNKETEVNRCTEEKI
jgi:hypothetical protein